MLLFCDLQVLLRYIFAINRQRLKDTYFLQRTATTWKQGRSLPVRLYAKHVGGLWYSRLKITCCNTVPSLILLTVAYIWVVPSSHFTVPWRTLECWMGSARMIWTFGGTRSLDTHADDWWRWKASLWDKNTRSNIFWGSTDCIWFHAVAEIPLSARWDVVIVSWIP